VKFDNHLVLEDISFEVKEDETLAVIGPNGAGKSVLFRTLLGLIPYEGTITWKENVKIGYVPQKLAISKDIPLTTSEFFSLKEKDKKRIEEVLTAVGFPQGEPHGRLGTLSGGELQRVLIAFALLGHPDVLLFDEPTSGVDVSAEETIYDLLHKLQEKENLTIILISHELQVVYRYADDVLCLNKEKVCFGIPNEVLGKESLQKLYGGEVKFYHHHD
jgi:zinc transport system ATP-binding protein